MVLCWALLFESFSGGADVCLFLSLELKTRCCLFQLGCIVLCAVVYLSLGFQNAVGCVLSVLYFAYVWVNACVVLFSLAGTHISLLSVAFVVPVR